MPAAARSSVAALAAVAATLLVLVVAVLAASAGPDTVLEGEGSQPSSTSEPQDDDVDEEAPPPREGEAEGRDEPKSTPSWIVALFHGLEWAALALVGLALLERLSRRRRRRLRHRRHPDDVPLDATLASSRPADELADDVADEITADAVAQRELLESGSPRNGIVACWHRFEVHAARAGLPREPWETSSEFTTRLLVLVRADAPSVATLTRLYREARFSENEVGESERADALEALTSLHRTLSRAVFRSPGGAR